jgi:uncharacterized spore protein YtfJ
VAPVAPVALHAGSGGGSGSSVGSGSASGAPAGAAVLAALAALVIPQLVRVLGDTASSMRSRLYFPVPVGPA